MTDLTSFYLRQSDSWGFYLKKIGWQTKRIKKTLVFYRKIPLTNLSVFKVPHPTPPIPFKQIDEFAKKENALCLILEPSAISFNQNIYLDAGFEISKIRFIHTATILIDITPSLEKVLKSFSENARRNIKKAQNSNLIIERVSLNKKNFEKDFKRFIYLWHTLSKLKGFTTPGEKELYFKMLGFIDKSYLLFAKNKNKEDIAVVWVIIENNTCNYAHTGITEEGYKTFANYLLVLEAIRLAKNKKAKVFDFEGIFDERYPEEKKSWKSFSEFKRRFHGQEIKFPPAQIKFYSILFKYFYKLNTFFEKP